MQEKNDFIDFKDFPKNYDYKSVEEKISKYWEDNDIYKFSLEDKGKDIYSVDTPPPYVSSAHLHVGHVMSYSQAEFIIRYKRMKGYNVFYPMGFDDNGLPTERYVEKKYKINKSKITREEFIDLCLKETKIGIDIYKSLWRSVGISADYSLSYSTIDERCRKTAQKSFLDLYGKGLIERRNEPILWCPQCRTSLAQADVVMEEFTGVLYDIEFKSDEGKGLIISTTRPELLGGCVAVYANPADERYRFLEGMSVKTPLYNKNVPVKYDESVDMSYGSGLMMVCTWGDAEDVKKWKEHSLDTAIIIDRSGRLNELSGGYKGLNVRDAKKGIVEDLRKMSLIKLEKPLNHNVGVHDRCSTPVEFILAEQWFIKILENKEKFIDAGNRMSWHPQFMKTRYDEWINNLKWDWNISRQRFYGVPFPVWYCAECGEVVVASEKELPVDPAVIMPVNMKCKKCGGSKLIPENDVMDTWMTSSLTPLINSLWSYEDAESKKLYNTIYPMGLRPQAQEIIRTWLFYTVVKSVYHTGDIPFKDVMISGWGLDKNGKKMSKSLGNFVSPEEITGKYSADALRYWASKANLGQDLRFSEEDVANGRRLTIKIWNAARFLITNVESDFNPYEKNVKDLKLSRIDEWILTEFENTLKSCGNYMESYEYSLCMRTLQDFFYNSYCDNYLEIIKNVFWDESEESSERKKTVLNIMYFISLNAVKMFAPFMPFITEELYLSFYKRYEKDKSIHKSFWPEFRNDLIFKDSLKYSAVLLNILDASRKLRTNLNLHQNHKVHKILIQALNQDYIEIINDISGDIRSAVRAERLIFSDQADFKASDDNILIALEK
ncbi:MAG: valine--tRNA ligase [Candidatus Acidulodesulfobacterium acidiphilum]|uniref:Valine--tRNA ligase n=1 Tax=Candidatus Acidulodesulfobacterium acidiphilum TaxID=2597224 RepID=A0A520XGP0_9DELT|nr:MAG: valine--tRNA ligase [Candidatus Acidulodesulfobacterium acidiphilum]